MEGTSDLLMKLARTTPYYKRNRPHICSFWVKGKCKRGEECPYRHEKPTDPDDPLSDQNIKDRYRLLSTFIELCTKCIFEIKVIFINFRYYGVNDPVAAKLMKRASVMPKLEPPEDVSITTLYIGNVPSFITEKDLKYDSISISRIYCHSTLVRVFTLILFTVIHSISLVKSGVSLVFHDSNAHLSNLFDEQMLKSLPRKHSIL